MDFDKLPDKCKQCLREAEEIGKRVWKCYPDYPLVDPCPYSEYISTQSKGLSNGSA